MVMLTLMSNDRVSQSSFGKNCFRCGPNRSGFYFDSLSIRIRLRADPPQNIAFVASYTLSTKTKKPNSQIVVCKQNGDFSLHAMDQASALHPENFNNPADPNAIQRYNHLLQWEILRRISLMYWKSWQTEIISLNRYHSRFNRRDADDDGRFEILDATKLHTIVSGNKFSFYTSAFDDVMPFQIALPPNTQVRVTPPKDSFKEDESLGTIEFSYRPDARTRTALYD
jgi:hypothetical protein